jgi:hypothetical protein
MAERDPRQNGIELAIEMQTRRHETAATSGTKSSSTFDTLADDCAYS